MAPLPVDVLTGIAYGLLIGLVPAVFVGAASFGAAYGWDYEVPWLAAVGVVLTAAGLNGWAVGLVTPAEVIVPQLLSAAIVAAFLAVYANSQGQALAADLPRGLSRASRTDRTLSADAADAIDGTGQVTVRPTGTVRDIEGYPPLSPEDRDRIAADTWRLPADLPLSELSDRLRDRLRTTYGLADANVSIDAGGRASIAAAPADNDLTRRVPDGARAVSIDVPVPTGLAPDDRVDLDYDEDETMPGLVLSVETAGVPGAHGQADGATVRDDAADGDGDVPRQPADGGSRGGLGRVTVAVRSEDADSLVESDSCRLVATSHGTSQSFEAFSLVERAGKEVRKVVLDETARETLQSEGEDVWPVAVRRSASEAAYRQRGWTFEPDGEAIADGEIAFVVGDPESAAFERVAGGNGRRAAGGETA